MDFISRWRCFNHAASNELKHIFFSDVTGPDYYGPNDRPEDLNRLSQALDINQLMLLLTESDTNGYFNNEIEQQG